MSFLLIRKSKDQPFINTTKNDVQNVNISNMNHKHENHYEFKDMGISPWLSDTLISLSIIHPTPVQSQCIPLILNRQNLIACSKTGSGKTATFAIPILQTLSKDPYGIYALIITPTRELAFQIAEQFKAFGQGIRIQVCVIVGGIDMISQAISITSRPHIIIATPGRLADLLTSSQDIPIHFSKLSYLVLDEADRLFEDSFLSSLKTIFSYSLSHNPQLLLFSATMTKQCKILAESLLNRFSPLSLISCESTQSTDDNLIWSHMVEKLDQKYLLVPSQVKDAYLIHILQDVFKECITLNNGNVIIFVNKCITAELVKSLLRHWGFKATALHSKLKQRERLASIHQFKSNISPILVATDVASRGLDIPTVQLVLNYDVPVNPVDYIHRVGRTARAGRGGLALTMIGERDVLLIKAIESKMNKKLEQFSDIDDDKPILEMLYKVMKAKRICSMMVYDKGFDEKGKIYKLKQERALMNTNEM